MIGVGVTVSASGAIGRAHGVFITVLLLAAEPRSGTVLSR